MTLFIEERLLDNVDYGSSYGTKFQTRIKGLKSGHETRNSDWAVPLGVYTIRFPILRPEDHATVFSAFMICKGRFAGFRLKDWSNYKAEQQFIGYGTGASQELQLAINYVFGTGVAIKEIYKPVDGTVIIYEDGSPISATIDTTTGLATFTATLDSQIRWSGEFDIPVRFDSDELHSTIEGVVENGLALTTDVELVEIRIS